MKKIAQVTANSVSLGNVDALGTELSVTQTERSISLNVSLQQVFHEVETSSWYYFSPGLLQLRH